MGFKVLAKVRVQLNKDNHKNEDNPKNQDILKNEDNLKNEDGLKNEDDFKMKMTLRMKMALKMKMTPKKKTINFKNLQNLGINNEKKISLKYKNFPTCREIFIERNSFLPNSFFHRFQSTKISFYSNLIMVPHIFQ